MAKTPFLVTLYVSGYTESELDIAAAEEATGRAALQVANQALADLATKYPSQLRLSHEVLVRGKPVIAAAPVEVKADAVAQADGSA